MAFQSKQGAAKSSTQDQRAAVMRPTGSHTFASQKGASDISMMGSSFGPAQVGGLNTKMTMSASRNFYTPIVQRQPQVGGRAKISMLSTPAPRVLGLSRQANSLQGAMHTFSRRGNSSRLQMSASQPQKILRSSPKNFTPGWGSVRDHNPRVPLTVMMAGAGSLPAEDTFVPDMERRTLMNLILLGSLGLSGGTLAYGFISFFIPVIAPAGAGGVVATDALGDNVTLEGWKAAHKPGDRALVQGLKGDATYLITTDDGIKDFAINAVCTHLGCVVPWSKA